LAWLEPARAGISLSRIAEAQPRARIAHRKQTEPYQRGIHRTVDELVDPTRLEASGEMQVRGVRHHAPVGGPAGEPPRLPRGIHDTVDKLVAPTGLEASGEMQVRGVRHHAPVGAPAGEPPRLTRDGQ